METLKLMKIWMRLLIKMALEKNVFLDFVKTGTYRADDVMTVRDAENMGGNFTFFCVFAFKILEKMKINILNIHG